MARMAVSARDVRLVQFGYPQIYFACHTRHLRRASTPTRLSAADSALLAHLHERHGIQAGALAHHLGVAASTLSAAVKRLTSQGYISQDRVDGDGRAKSLRLARAGVAAMQAGSVLETARVRAMLGRLSGADRKRAVAGLSLLAKAARCAREVRR
ncbi:MAG TPA: MarR family winged helix-turn-helix transcriptional regulator [Vicinamibacterales bacterium]